MQVPILTNLNRPAMLALVALVVAAGVVGVRVADPMAPAPESPGVDLDDPPAEVAYAAMRQTATRNFEVRYERRSVGPGVENNQRYRARYDNAHARVAYHPLGSGRMVAFENPYYRWDSRQDTEDRRVNQRGLDGQFHAERRVLNCSCVTTTHENASVLVLRIDDPALVPTLRLGPGEAGDVESAWLDLYIGKATGQLQATAFRLVIDTTDGLAKLRVTERYRRWGAVTVERPDWAGYSRGEFVLDLLNYERER
jgi:hypothetical protein